MTARTTRNIAVLVGSLRKESYNLKLAKALTTLAPAELSLNLIPIGALPLFNQDLESTPPDAWVEFRDRIRPASGVLFITPEYNRSVPGVLKNAIDVGSRPPGKSVWNKKPGAIISASPGQLGAFGANHHLRQCLVSLNVPLLQQPEAYLGGVAQMFDDNGALVEKPRELMTKFITAYASWVEKLATE